MADNRHYDNRWFTDLNYREEATERLAQAFHERYEWWAERHGWATQERSRVAWADVPEENKKTMRSVIKSLADEGVIVVPDAR